MVQSQLKNLPDKSLVQYHKFMITRKEKIKLLKQVKKRVAKTKAIILTDFTGLSVLQMEELRSKLREKEIKLQVLKKSLVKRMWPDFDYDGSVALAYCGSDEVVLCSILNKFSQNNKSLKILQGRLNNELLDLNKIKSLASFGSQEAMLNKIASIVKSPINKLILCLKQEKIKKEKKQ